MADKDKERQLLAGSMEGDIDQEARKCKLLDIWGEKIKNSFKNFQNFARKAWEMGRSDPRKVIFAMKMGLALALVSLLIFWKGLSEDVSQYSIWAVLTVIVMFEFSIGATFIKGFNRVLGTICAGVLAFSFAELSVLAGEWETVVIITSIFITGFCSSYLRLYPTAKPYDYGFRVFTLTYCILTVAGNRTRHYAEAVVSRLVLIAIGAGVCFVVNVFIYPIWAGDALHSSVVKNFEDVATSLEGCVNGYLKGIEYERVPSRILTFQAYDDPLYNGYKAVMESTSREDTLLGFAIWEPPHGRFRMFNYPWRDYVQLSGAVRHCAFMVMALHGCILSEIQAPAERRQVFLGEFQKVGAEAAKVLRELGSKVDKMARLSPGDILKEVHEAAEQLQKKIDHKSYLLVNSESWEIGSHSQESPETENVLVVDVKERENMQLGAKSLSETVLNIQDNMFRKQESWPSRLSLDANAGARKEHEGSKTYESASALSLATFASLLIELVARLQNVVDSFEELSAKADFALDSAVTTRRTGFCISLLRCFGY